MPRSEGRLAPFLLSFWIFYRTSELPRRRLQSFVPANLLDDWAPMQEIEEEPLTTKPEVTPEVDTTPETEEPERGPNDYFHPVRKKYYTNITPETQKVIDPLLQREFLKGAVLIELSPAEKREAIDQMVLLYDYVSVADLTPEETRMAVLKRTKP